MFENSRDKLLQESRSAWIASIGRRCESLVRNIDLLKKKDPLKAERFEGLLRESREWISAIV